jgi:hypothetical protein
MNDLIVEEVRRIRAEIAARNGNDLRRIFEDARAREGSDGRRVVSYDPADAAVATCVVREAPPKP